MALDAMEFRKVLGQFATGVTVVTTVHEGVRQAMTVSSFSSVSLDPPLVLFCADKRSRTHPAVAASGVFAVNILREEQRGLSDLFAGRGTDAERQVALSGRAAETGSPILEGVLAYLDCRVTSAHDAGDHVIYVGEVVAAGLGDTGAPLLYYRGTYQALEEAWRWRDRYAAREKATRFHDMVDFFDRMQGEGPYAALIDGLVALADPAEDARCLDIGCGAGRLVRELAGRSREAVGVDVSAAMIERATHRARALGLENAHYLEAQASALPFPGGEFDVVTASNLFLHVADPAAVLAEAARVLRPGGRLALLEPAATMTRASMTTYIREHGHSHFGANALLAWADAAEVGGRYDEERMTAHLRDAGFQVTQQIHEMAGLAVLLLARRG